MTQETPKFKITLWKARSSTKILIWCSIFAMFAIFVKLKCSLTTMVFFKIHVGIFTYNWMLTICSNRQQQCFLSQEKLPNVQADITRVVVLQYMCNQVKHSCKHGNPRTSFHHRHWSVKIQRSSQDILRKNCSESNGQGRRLPLTHTHTHTHTH